MRRVLLAVILSVSFSSFAYGKSTEELLAEINALPSAQRQQRLEEGAKREGKLTTYGVPSVGFMGEILKGFMARYPYIRAEHWRGSSSRTLDRLLTEKRAGKVLADIVIGGTSEIEAYKKAKIPARYHSPAAKVLAEGFKDEAGHWVALEYLPVVIAYNTNLVPQAEAPKGYEDLLQPKWKGKISIDSDPENLVQGLLIEWGEERTRSYLSRLAQQDLQVRKGHTLQVQLLCAGEFSISSEVYSYQAVRMIHDGCPIKVIFPNPSPSSMTPMQLVEGGPDPHAAALFYDFMLTPEGMRLYGREGRIPSHPQVEARFPELRNLAKRVNIRLLRPEAVGPQRDKVHRILSEILFRGRR